jgi:hypothetical protein
MRRLTTFAGPAFAILVFASIQLGLFFEVIKVTEVTYQLGAIHLSCSSLTLSCMTNTMVFCARNVANSLFSPSNLTVIKSSVTSEKLTKVEARILRSAFHFKEALLLKDEAGEGTKHHH